jgi:hypothetical protein
MVKRTALPPQRLLLANVGECPALKIRGPALRNAELISGTQVSNVVR